MGLGADVAALDGGGDSRVGGGCGGLAGGGGGFAGGGGGFAGDGDGFADLAGQDQLLNSLSITYAVPVFGYVLKLKFTKIMKKI